MRMLWDPPPGIQPSGSPCAARRRALSSRTVLGGKGSLRRGKLRRALASSAPFREQLIATGGSAGNQMAEQFLRLTKDENQMVVDKTS